MGTPVPKVLLTSTSNGFEARVIQARLRAEGLDAELRGAIDSPYPFTVGGLAEVAVYVPEEQVDDARLVMLATEVDSAVGTGHESRRSSTRADVVSVVLVAIIAVVVAVARILQLAW